MYGTAGAAICYGKYNRMEPALTMNRETMGSPLIDQSAVYDALRECYDPEIPVNIVDLGLVYDVRIKDDDIVEVDFTLTAPGCSMSGMIREDIRTRLLQVEGIKDAVVNIVWEPLWTPDKMSEDARKALGFG